MKTMFECESAGCFNLAEYDCKFQDEDPNADFGVCADCHEYYKSENLIVAERKIG
jgi:hypothetical protein